MKYIRTKDGIYGVYFVNDNGVNIETKSYFETKNKRFFLHDFIPNERIIAKADTIEELCDYLIVFDNDNKISDFVKISERPKDLIENKLFVEHLFGSNYTLAIETDRGLIYIARMNEKGELCLI